MYWQRPETLLTVTTWGILPANCRTIGPALLPAFQDPGAADELPSRLPASMVQVSGSSAAKLLRPALLP
jgi:hypothetical protein